MAADPAETTRGLCWNRWKCAKLSAFSYKKGSFWTQKTKFEGLPRFVLC